MHHKVLVVDDSIDQRELTYMELSLACEDPVISTPPSFAVELVFARSPWEVDDLLRNNYFSAVILDVVLKKWHWSQGHPVLASEILAKLDDAVPVALLSAEWVSDEVKGLVAEWPTKNCRMFIHWDDLSEPKRLAEGSLTRVLFELAKHIEDYAKLDYSLGLGIDDPIRIVHLSDLQFGGFNDWKLGLEAGHCATTIKKKWKTGQLSLR